MTHDELLADIDKVPRIPWAQYISALRAVVELHKPHSSRMPFCSVCTQVIQGIEDSVLYPCPTIQAIEKELG
mgnify:CR=1 FL=1